MDNSSEKRLEELHEATVLVRSRYGITADGLGDFDPAQMQILVALAIRPGMTVTEIADELHFRHPTVSNAMRDLAEGKLVRSTPSSSDGRKHLYVLRRAGQIGSRSSWKGRDENRS